MTSAEHNQQIASLTRKAIDERVFPGGVVGYLRNGNSMVLPFGRLRYEHDAPEVQPDTVYDVASITKSVPTSSLLLQMIESGSVGLDDRVIDYIPDLDNQYRERITIRHLLTYTVIFNLPNGLSGLVAEAGKNFIPELLRSPLMASPGERYFYTNPPALLMGMIIEKVGGTSLDRLANEHFFQPLGMHHSTFDPSGIANDAVAPSEMADDTDIQGVVHDESARMMREMGQRSGVAGLFTTAGDLLRFSRMMMNGGELDGRRYLDRRTIEEAAQNQLDAIGEHTGLGWEIHRPDVMGATARPHTLIKSGHTGCLLVIDLENQAATVYLSNRTYPHRSDRAALRAYWRALNELFYEFLQ
jgi:CubicO group peptidase (beta-lactamase class C family)